MADSSIAKALRIISVSSPVSLREGLNLKEAISPVDNVASGLLEMNAGDVLFMLRKSWQKFINGDFPEGLSCAQIALDFVWEKLNTGNWKDIDRRWRETYTIGSLLHVICLMGMKAHKREIFKSVDLGLMMGVPLMGNILTKLAKIIEEQENMPKERELSKVQIQNVEILEASEQDETGSKNVLKRKMIGESERCADFSEEAYKVHKVKQLEEKYNIEKHKEIYVIDQERCVEDSTLNLVTDTVGVSYPTIELDESKLIQRVKKPSLEYFYSNCILSLKPMIIENAIDHWPAMTSRRWSPDYLCKLAGHRTVPVEIGDRYTSEDWTQKLITINEFVENFIKCDHEKGYLAQHQLFDQIPDLKQDICIPDYCCLGDNDSENVIINAWFGPSGTVSPLHQDPYNNVFAQVVGKKYIRLYDKCVSDSLYPYDSHLLDNTSQVDIENPDLEKFPLYAEAPYLECILEEGELLYIPKKFWHYVKSLSLSFSVSFWWG